MSLFEQHKVLHGLPTIGQQIMFMQKTRSWFINVNEDQEKLVIGQAYTVRKTQLNSSSTYVWLAEFPNIFDDTSLPDGRDQPFFNMGSFKWWHPPIDFNSLIGLGVRSCLRLNSTYGVGVYLNGICAVDGDPNINIEYNLQNNIVIRAGWFNCNKKDTYMKSDKSFNDDILDEMLRIIPCSYVPNHTREKLPAIVKDLVEKSVRLSQIEDIAITLKNKLIKCECNIKDVEELLNLIIEEYEYV